MTPPPPCAIFNETNFNLAHTRPTREKKETSALEKKNKKCTSSLTWYVFKSVAFWYVILHVKLERSRTQSLIRSNQCIKHFNLFNIILRFHLKTLTAGTTKNVLPFFGHSLAFSVSLPRAFWTITLKVLIHLTSQQVKQCSMQCNVHSGCGSTRLSGGDRERERRVYTWNVN